LRPLHPEPVPERFAYRNPVKQINKINTLLRNNMQQRATKYHSFRHYQGRLLIKRPQNQP